MEPITTGAIALLLFCGNKLIDWSISKAYDAAFDKLMEKSPDTAEKLALPPGKWENIGEAVLVEMVENTAKDEPELRTALEALGKEVQAAANKNTKLEKAFNQLAQTVKAQSQNTPNITYKIADTVEKVGQVIQNSTIEQQTNNFY